jgi:hypothetical protein
MTDQPKLGPLAPWRWPPSPAVRFRCLATIWLVGGAIAAVLSMRFGDIYLLLAVPLAAAVVVGFYAIRCPRCGRRAYASRVFLTHRSECPDCGKEFK